MTGLRLESLPSTQDLSDITLPILLDVSTFSFLPEKLAGQVSLQAILTKEKEY